MAGLAYPATNRPFCTWTQQGGSPFVLTCNYCHSKNYAVSLSRMIDYLHKTVEETLKSTHIGAKICLTVNLDLSVANW